MPTTCVLRHPGLTDLVAVEDHELVVLLLAGVGDARLGEDGVEGAAAEGRVVGRAALLRVLRPGCEGPAHGDATQEQHVLALRRGRPLCELVRLAGAVCK
eukprot:1522929-Rhodomonas_salina.2